MSAEKCKKIAYIAVTLILMLAVSRFIVRIVDATVQIDDDIGVLILLLVLVNAIIAAASRVLYMCTKK